QNRQRFFVPGTFVAPFFTRPPPRGCEAREVPGGCYAAGGSVDGPRTASGWDSSTMYRFGPSRCFSRFASFVSWSISAGRFFYFLGPRTPAAWRYPRRRGIPGRFQNPAAAGEGVARTAGRKRRHSTFPWGLKRGRKGEKQIIRSI